MCIVKINTDKEQNKIHQFVRLSPGRKRMAHLKSLFIGREFDNGTIYRSVGRVTRTQKG